MSLIAYKSGIEFDSPPTQAQIEAAGFVERVMLQVFPDREPENLRFPIETYIRNGLILAQTYVECLRGNNVDVYEAEDISVNCNVAIIDGPEHVRNGAVYAYKPGQACKRQHYRQVSVGEIMGFVDKYSTCKCRTENDICNAIRNGQAICDDLAACSTPDNVKKWECEDKIFAVGSGGKLYVAPRFPCGYKLAVHWEGIKYRYGDADLIGDEPDFQDLVATFVQAERAKNFDRDLQLYGELFGKGPGKNGIATSAFHGKLRMIEHRCREERRVRKTTGPDLWEDSAVSSVNIGANLDPVPARNEAGIVWTKCDGCPEGQYLWEGQCVDCLNPQVTLTANVTTIVSGGVVKLTWSSMNIVPIDASVVTLEYGNTVLTLNKNESGTLDVSPTEDTTYTIKAKTVCGNVSASVTVIVTAEAACGCPEGLPDCLQIKNFDPDMFLDNGNECATGTPSAAPAWNGQMPRNGTKCQWGYDIGTYSLRGKSLQVRLVLLECVESVQLYGLFVLYADNVVWRGEATHSPVGTFNRNVTLDCGPLTVQVEGCAACNSLPGITFDPPAGSQVSFPTTAFITSDDDTALIFYTLDGTEPNNNSTLYTGPIELEEGDELRAVAINACIGDSHSALYTSSQSVELDLVCDVADRAGEVGEFAANGSQDLHFDLNFTLANPANVVRLDLRETNSHGVPITGHAWSTSDNTLPPIVVDETAVQLNSDYIEPVAVEPAGAHTWELFAQPVSGITGYFRIKVTINEGSGDVEIYKIVSHSCYGYGEPPVPPTNPGDVVIFGAFNNPNGNVFGTIGQFYKSVEALGGDGSIWVKQSGHNTNQGWI